MKIKRWSRRKLTLDEFIEKARRIHGWKYDYSKVVYIDSQTNIIIICPIHGEFLISPANHLSGKSCRKCWNEKIGNINRSNINDFKLKAFEIHGSNNDYSKAIYINNHSKLCITCLLNESHGDYWQTPKGHLSGQGCPKCCIDNIKLNQQEIIKRFIELHGNKFDYSKVVYLGYDIKVTLICPIHGEFEQTPGNHLRGQGCPKCSKEILFNSRKSTLEEIIINFIKVHGNKYGYSLVNYINNRTKIIIICPEHGEFEQLPNNHLQGQGCPKCKSSKGEVTIRNILEKYSIKSKEEYIIPKQKYKFKYDFYLPEYNLLIEFHGIQHYNFIPFFHESEEEYLAKKEVDDFKKNFAMNECGYRFLEFNYKQLKELSKEQFEELVIYNIDNSLIRKELQWDK